jgi:hypothetical protein
MIFTFGKYRGQSVEELSNSIEGVVYLRWLLKQKWVHTHRLDIYKELNKYDIIYIKDDKKKLQKQCHIQID